MSAATDVSKMSTDPGLQSYVFKTDLAPGLPDPAERAAVWNLLRFLQVCAHSAVDGQAGISPVLDSRRWIALEDAPESTIAAAVARTATRNAPWSLPQLGDGDASLIERLNVYFARIERRARAAVTG
jgi:hypothetical protein